MGACFHIAGTTCDNCRPSGTISSAGTLRWQPVRTPEMPPYATVADVAALAARLAALEAEVARLTEKLGSTGTVSASSPNSCPECESTDVQMLPWILTSEPPQQPWACRSCDCRWNTYC